MKNTIKKEVKKPSVRVKKVTNIDGYDMGQMTMTIQAVQDKTGRVEYVLFATLYVKNNTDNIYDVGDKIINQEGMSKEDIEKERFEKISFQVPLINENRELRGRLVQLMEDALKLKIEHRLKVNRDEKSK